MKLISSLEGLTKGSKETLIKSNVDASKFNTQSGLDFGN